jgi:hypothetical protein
MRYDMIMYYLMKLSAKALTEEHDEGDADISPLSSVQEIRPVTSQDNAYHFPQYLGKPHTFWYTEWWYFNFFDSKNNIAGMLTFAVFNPSNIDQLGIASLTVGIVRSSEHDYIEPVVEYIHLDKFSASTETADLTLAGNTLTVINDETYRVSAKSNDGRITFNLTYRQADTPQYFIRQERGDYWNMNSWLNYMPSAFVDGEVILNGEVLKIERAAGYHDHDWGMWKVYKETWNWAAVSIPEEEISFDVVFQAAFQKSTSYFRYKELRLYLPQENFKLTQNAWLAWKDKWKYPTQMTFECEDDTGCYKVQVNWTVLDTLTIWKYPLIVFEQTALFEGGLYEKIDGNWQLLCSLRSHGFCEYTGKWLS